MYHPDQAVCAASPAGSIPSAIGIPAYQHPYPGYQPSPPDRSGEIHSQFKRLNELIRLNAELIGGLSDRLACVMPPQPPAGIKDCGAQAHLLVSPFADELRNLAGRVDAANCDLQQIMERLEL